MELTHRRRWNMSDLNNLTVQGRIVKNEEFTTTDAGLRIA